MTKIENKAQYDWAVNRVEELLPLVDDNTPKDDKNLIELELLSSLVAEHFAVGTASLADVMKLRMYEMHLTQRSLAAMLGISPSRVSAIVSGKAEPTYKVAQEISRKLNIDAGIVLGVC